MGGAHRRRVPRRRDVPLGMGLGFDFERPCILNSPVFVVFYDPFQLTALDGDFVVGSADSR